MQLRPIALIQASLAGLIVAASGSSSFALTEAAASHNHQPQQSPNLIAQSPEPGNACDLDTRLAARVLNNALFDRTYSTRSLLMVEGFASGATLNVEAQVTTLTQAPGQFRSEIVFTDSNNRNQSEYLITSNGEQVWIYDKLGDRYSTMSQQAFDDSDDDFLIGFMASLGLTIQADFSDIEAMRQLSEAQMAVVLTESIAPCRESGLSIEMQHVNGQSYQTFRYENKAEGVAMTGFMNRKTGRLDYFNLSGNEEGVDFLMNEKIISRIAMPEVASTTFEFIPPTTAQEAEGAISIGPF